MSFLKTLAKQKSVPEWFLKATKEGRPKAEIISMLEEECHNSPECRKDPVLWNDKSISSFANSLFEFYSKRLKTN